MREVSLTYSDPLERVWTTTLARMGIQLVRSEECFASYDGVSTLTLGASSTLDGDDCLAQMVLHELCHSLVQGPSSFTELDWGLRNTDDSDLAREYACLRVQAALLDPHGLRKVLAATTDHRSFYDRLGPTPLLGESADAALARAAWPRRHDTPWHPHLERALTASAAIIHTTAPFCEASDLLKL